MPYYVINNFGKGVDRRRPEVGALPGTLYVGEDVHVSDGGTVQVRKAFDPTYTLPIGFTQGFARASGLLYVFGHVDPALFVGPLALPAGINYLRCEHPGGFALTRMLSYDVFDGKVYCACEFSDGSVYHFYDGTRVTQTFDGRARASFAILTGSAATGTVTSIKANGVEILGATVNWATSHSNFASLIAAQINSYVSVPNYTATAAGAVVHVAAAAGTGGDVNGYVLSVTPGGDVTVTTPQDFLNGVTDAPDPGPYVKTIGTKMYYVSGSLMAFSGVNRPVQYDENAIGAGAINVSNHVSGSEELQAIVEYLGMAAVFSKEALTLWSLSADPLLNARVQTITGVDLLARRAAVGYGKADIAFLTNAGVRALRPSEVVSNTSEHVSISDPINKLLLEDLRTLDIDVLERAVSTVDPVDRRLLIAIGERVYVLSLFSESGIAAWSRYNIGAQITDWVIHDKRLYARAGNTIYLYGGADNDTYDAAVVPVVKMVNLEGAAPATYKGWNGFDFGLIGEWEISMYAGVDSTTAEAVANISGSSYNAPTIPVAAEASHVALEFTGRASAREIVNVALHYNRHEAD